MNLQTAFRAAPGGTGQHRTASGCTKRAQDVADGRGLASLGADNDFHLWDTSTGAETRWLRKPVDFPRRYDEMAEMMMMQARMRRMVQRNMNFLEREYGTPQHAAFSPDGKLL